MVCQGLKYNTIGNAINDDSPKRNAAKSKMVNVEETPDLVTTNQNDQIKTTEIPAINPNKYSPLMLIEGLTININSFLKKT